jgi:hypothetical protein
LIKRRAEQQYRKQLELDAFNDDDDDEEEEINHLRTGIANDAKKQETFMKETFG